MINIVICDHDHKSHGDIITYVSEYCSVNNIRYHIDEFYSVGALEVFVESGNSIDLIFIEVEMEDADSIALGHLLLERMKAGITIVYLSKAFDRAMELFDIRPFDFICKPVNQLSIIKAIKNVNKEKRERLKTFYYWKDRVLRKELADNIVFFTINEELVSMYKTNELIRFYSRWQDVKNRTDGMCFWEISDAFIVNIKYVILFEYDKLHLINGMTLPISKEKRRRIKTLREHKERISISS